MPESPGSPAAPKPPAGPAGGTGGKPAPSAAGGGAASNAAKKPARPPAGTMAPARGPPGTGCAPPRLRPRPRPRAAPRPPPPRPRPPPLPLGGIAARRGVLERSGGEGAAKSAVGKAEPSHVHAVGGRLLRELGPQCLKLHAQVATYAQLLEGVWIAHRRQAELLRSEPTAGCTAGPGLPGCRTREAGSQRLGLLSLRGRQRGGRERHATSRRVCLKQQHEP